MDKKLVGYLYRFVSLFLMLAIISSCETPLFTKTELLKEELQLVNSEFPYQLVVLAEDLNVPWAMDIAPDGRIFFTERPGQVRVIVEGVVQEEPVISFPEPFLHEGEGGLLGLVLDPNFEVNHLLYVYHSYEEQGVTKNRLLRLREQDNRGEIDAILLENLPGNRFHNGGRIKIGPDGYLYVTVGDAQDPPLSQDLNSLAGKILRIGLDGSIPTDNPFSDSPIYSWGHRNAQGLAWHPETGELYSSEHGPSAFDEINLISSGGNYGWPLAKGDEIPPIIHSGEETWAPSGITFVTQGPWQNQLLVANLRGEQLLRIPSGEIGESALKSEALFKGEFGRIRDIVEGKGGVLYFLTNNRDGRGNPQPGDDRIIMLIPKTKE